MRLKSCLALFADVAAAWRMAPLALFIALPALVMRSRLVIVAPDASAIWPMLYFGDMRGWLKEAFAAGIAAWMLLSVLLRLPFSWRPRFGRWGALLALAAGVTLLSAVLSPYPQSAWLGATTQYEGAFALLAYLVAAWYAAEMADGKAQRVAAVRCIGMVGLVNAALGIAQGFGFNFWRTGIGAWLAGTGDRKITYRFGDLNIASGTMFQPNHFGMFMAVMGGLAFGMIVAETSRRWRAFWSVTLAACLGGVFFSNSRAGTLTLLAVIVVAVVVLALRRRAIFLRRRNALLYGLIGVAAVLFFAGTAAGRHAAGRFASRLTARKAPPAAGDREVRAVFLRDNRIHIRMPDETIRLHSPRPDAWVMENDMQSRRLPAEEIGDGWRKTPLPGIPGGELSFTPRGNVRLRLDAHGPMRFYNVGGRIFAVDEAEQRLLDEIPEYDYRPSGYEFAASLRGYIWLRAMEAVRNRPWIGHGPGSFAQAFPNDDLYNRRRFSVNDTIDKGHGIWCAWLVQLGILGLLAYALPVLYAMRRAYRAVRAGRDDALLRGLLPAMAAYLICSLTNDSTVGVTPIFCVIAGLTVAETEDAETPGCA